MSGAPVETVVAFHWTVWGEEFFDLWGGDGLQGVQASKKIFRDLPAPEKRGALDGSV